MPGGLPYQPWAEALMKKDGYETEDLFATLKAFQRHWRPARVNGRIDWQTACLAGGLCAMLSRGAG